MDFLVSPVFMVHEKTSIKWREESLENGKKMLEIKILHAIDFLFLLFLFSLKMNAFFPLYSVFDYDGGKVHTNTFN